MQLARVALTSMVACLFARNVYKEELLARCLRSLGYPTLADNLPELSRQIQKLRWKTRLATGFDPQGVTIPERFSEVSNWKGPVEEGFLQDLKEAYADRIRELARG
jgi:aldehyde:ferredoxin oxidoreductase